MPSRILCAIGCAAAALLLLHGYANAETVTVELITTSGGYGYPNSVRFSPASVTVHVGDTVEWDWESGPHSVTAGTPGHSSGVFDSGIQSAGYSFSYTFTQAGNVPYFCMVHGSMMTGSVNVVAASSPALVNLSTRMRVDTGNNVLIGGFIVNGSAPKRIAVRGLGPSLNVNGQPIAGTIPNPFLELHDGSGNVVQTNDDWQAGPDAQELAADGLAPGDSRDAALISSLSPGNYTAILRDANGATGIGLVELYDIDTSAASSAVNISTRGLVQTGDNVMIGGFIIGGSTSQRVLARAIGPSLQSAGISNALQNPTLELHNGNGGVVASNDDWKSAQQADIEATGVAPTDDREAALIATLPPAGYTAIVRGVNDTTGVGLVEVYQLN